MKAKVTVKTDSGKTLTVNLIPEGGAYGLNGCLKADKEMVEFLDKNYLVSSYYLSTLLKAQWREKSGLCLDGGNRDYDISAEELAKALDAAVNEFRW